MDETTTGQATEETGAMAQAQALPAEQSATPAEASQEQASSTTSATGDDRSLPNVTDEEMTKFAESHGLDISDPNVHKIVKIAVDNQRNYQRANSKASQLSQSLEVGQPQDGEMQEFFAEYRRDKMINAFKDAHPDWREAEPVMAEKLSEEVATSQGVFTRSQLVNAGILSLDDIYAMTRGVTNTQVIKDEAKQEVLHSLANEQRAGGVSANATTPTTAQQKDPILESIRKAREES